MNKVLRTILIVIWIIIVTIIALAIFAYYFIFPSQMEKARDTTRILNIISIQSAIEQVYQDTLEYPADLNDQNISTYLPLFRIDRNDGIEKNGCVFGYNYEVYPGTNNIPRQKYRLSTCLENLSNIEKRAAADGGIYDDKYEVFN